MSQTRSPYESERDDGVNVKCEQCGCNIHAGKFPPICSECMPFVDIAVWHDESHSAFTGYFGE